MHGRQVFALGLSQLVGWGVLFYALIPLQHAHAFGVPASTSSLLITLALVVSGIMAYPVGVLLDRVGGRNVLLAGSIAGAVVLLALAFSPVAGLLPLFVILGVVHAMMLYEPAFAMITAHVSDAGARAMALRGVTLLGGLASLVFAPLTALLADVAGPRPTLVVLAGLLAAVTIPLHLRMPSGPGASRVQQPPHSAASSEEPAARSTRAVFTVTVVFAVAAFVATAVLFLLLAHLAERGISATQGSVLLGLAGACQLVGRLLHPGLARAWSPVTIVAIGLACQSVGAVGLLLGTAGLPVFLLAFGGGSGLLTVARPALVEYLFGLRGFGRMSAVIATAAVLARAAAPVAVAVTAPLLPSTIALVVLAVLSSLAVLGLPFGLARPLRRQPEPAAGPGVGSHVAPPPLRARRGPGRSRPAGPPRGRRPRSVASRRNKTRSAGRRGRPDGPTLP